MTKLNQQHLKWSEWRIDDKSDEGQDASWRVEMEVTKFIRYPLGRSTGRKPK